MVTSKSTNSSAVSSNTPVGGCQQSLIPKVLHSRKRTRSPSSIASSDGASDWLVYNFYCSVTFCCNNSSSKVDWLSKLIIPTRFSKSTMKCIDVGILSSHARDEVINSLSTCIMLFTTSPTPEERKFVCKRLIDVHPSLKDSIGSGYVCYFKI